MNAAANCEACGLGLHSCLVCESCGVLQGTPTPADPFAAFGLERVQDLDEGALGKRLVRLTRRMHPDFFVAGEPTQRALAERNSAELNAAHAVLVDPARRAALLIQLGGGPSQHEERQMPQAFLMEVLEWNEALDAARESAPSSAERAALGPLETELQEQRGEAMAAVSRALCPLPPAGDPKYTEVRRQLNAVRYTDRALGEIRELALDRAARD